jgi:chromosomal replication initiation ATPase DnaA
VSFELKSCQLETCLSPEEQALWFNQNKLRIAFKDTHTHLHDPDQIVKTFVEESYSDFLQVGVTKHMDFYL